MKSFIFVIAAAALTTTDADTCDTTGLTSELTESYTTQCTTDSGFSLTSLEMPDTDTIVKMCNSADCAELVIAVYGLDLGNCTVGTLNIQEFIDTFEAICASPPVSVESSFDWSSTASSTGVDTSSTSSAADATSLTSGSSGKGSSSTNTTKTSMPSQGSSTTGLIVGVGVGVLVVLGLGIVIWVCIRRKKQIKASENPTRTYRSATTPNRINRNELRPPSCTPLAASGLWTDPAITVFRIPLEKVYIETLVSQGGYGEVYRGTYKDQCVAIKMLQPALRNDMKQINSFLAEAKIMASIEHERLVTFVGVAWDSLRDLCVVTEFMEGGDLRSLLKQFGDENTKMQGFDADKTKIAWHVAHALAYLHSLKPVVIHRDLKSRNILLDSEWNAKLTDFGISREASDQTMTAGVGTTLWMAPEVMMGERYDEKADIFSFGVVLTELDSHQMPYASAKSTDSGRPVPDTSILQRVAMGRLQAEFSTSAPQWLREMGASCLSLDPKDRPTAAELLYALQTRMM